GSIADYTKAIEIDPNYAKAYLNRGRSKLMLGQKDSGCLDLSKAGELGYGKAYEVIKEYCN
ncbi:tetratricopeptide repeat protein, partial [Saprospiraceae bacterium]|nr:tetratricopeptide repeat protein [Saprospiraceae bacterium]